MKKIFDNFKLGNISICRLEPEKDEELKFKFFKHTATGLTYRTYEIGRNHLLIVDRIFKGYNKNLYAFGVKISEKVRTEHIEKLKKKEEH